MSERDRYEPSVPCWVDTSQPDQEAAMSFYGELFGWDFVGPGPGDYFVARLRGQDVAGIRPQPSEGAPAVPAWTSYVAVASADESARRASEEGGTVIAAPVDVLPAGRMAVVADPDGAAFCLWEAGERHGAQLVNEPSAWSMSALSSRDPERARAFYGALFGWTTETLEMGGGEVTMWRLPGYVGGEPEQPVSREVVATMMTADASTPPHWSADFWIADIDDAAAKMPQLGGKVVQEPYDVPGTTLRQAVLADPAGTVFSATQLTGVP
jgi:predicted enzyme related to lactoylglutathione lyase